MTLSVTSAAISDPIKLFTGLNHTNPPEKFLAHLSAQGSFQLLPQPLDLQSYFPWHARRMSLLYSSLTGTVFTWYDGLPQVYKNDWSSFLRIFEKHAYHAQLEALSLEQFALKKKLFLNKADSMKTCPPSNSKVMKLLLVISKQIREFANKRQFKQISCSLEPSIPYHSVLNMIDIGYA